MGGDHVLVKNRATGDERVVKVAATAAGIEDSAAPSSAAERAPAPTTLPLPSSKDVGALEELLAQAPAADVQPQEQEV